MTNVSLPFLLISILTSLLLPSMAELLAVEVSTKLPSARYGTSAIYDGNDIIYIFGGYNIVTRTHLADIVKFTLSTEEVKIVASLPVPMSNEVTSIDYRTGDIYFHHGTSCSPAMSLGVYKYIPNTNTVELVANLSTWNFNCAAVPAYDNPAEVYILGGFGIGTHIAIFTMDDHTFRKAGELTREYSYAGAVSDGTGSAILFGNHYNGYGYPPAKITFYNSEHNLRFSKPYFHFAN